MSENVNMLIDKMN